MHVFFLKRDIGGRREGGVEERSALIRDLRGEDCSLQMLISKALDNHRQNPRAGGGGGGTGRGAAGARRWDLPTQRALDGRTRRDPAGTCLPSRALEESGWLYPPPGRRAGQEDSSSGGDRWRPQPQPRSRFRRSRAAADTTSAAPGAAASRAPHSADRAMGPSRDWAPHPSPHPLWFPPLPPPRGQAAVCAAPSLSRAPSSGSLRPLPPPDPFAGPPWPRPSLAAWSARSGRRGSSIGTGRLPAGGGAAPARTAGSATATWWISSPKCASSASRSAGCGAKVCVGHCWEVRPRISPISLPAWGLFGLPPTSSLNTTPAPPTPPPQISLLSAPSAFRPRELETCSQATCSHWKLNPARSRQVGPLLAGCLLLSESHAGRVPEKIFLLWGSGLPLGIESDSRTLGKRLPSRDTSGALIAASQIGDFRNFCVSGLTWPRRSPGNLLGFQTLGKCGDLRRVLSRGWCKGNEWKGCVK